MSTEKKKPLNRDQALNDATNGQMGEDHDPVPYQIHYLILIKV